jgi:hypothetical protein
MTMVRTALFSLLVALTVGAQAGVRVLDAFDRPANWEPVKDTGNAPALTVVKGGLQAVYKEAKPGWGNLAHAVRLQPDDTAFRLKLRVVDAQPRAAMHLWLVEPDGDMWLAQLAIDGKSIGALGKGEYTFTVPFGTFGFQPRGKGTKEQLSCRRLMLGFNFADQTVVLENLAVLSDPAALAKREAAEAARKAEAIAALAKGVKPESAMYRIALFDDPQIPTPTVPSSPDELAKILAGTNITITRIDAAGLSDPKVLDAEKIDLLVLPYGPSFPAKAEDSIRAFCEHGGDFLSLGGYAFDQPYFPTAEDRPSNLVLNPGFEEPDTSMWGLDKASMQQQGDTSQIVRRISTGDAQEGTKCFELTVPDSAPKTWYNVSQRVDGVEPGHNYLATCQLRTKEVHNGFAYMAVGFYGKDNKRISFVNAGGARGEGTIPWSEQSAAFTVPAGTAYATINGHLYGFGTAWFDNFCLKEANRVTLNTRHGNPRDALGLRNDQIGVFDPSYVFERTTHTDTSPLQHIVTNPVELRAGLEGYVAVGMTSPNNAVSPKPRARWTSLVQAFDDYGRLTGTVLGISHNFSGTFKHSLWAYCGVENRDLAKDASFATALQQVRDHLRRGAFLHSPHTEYMLYNPGETVQASAHVANASKVPAQYTVRFRLLDQGKTVAEKETTVALMPGADEKTGAVFSCPSTPRGTLEMRAELLADGTAIDLVRTGFLLPLPSDTKGLDLGYQDNYFTASGRPAMLFGTNQTGVMFGPDYENVLTWMEDYGRCRDYGLNVWRLLHISPFADPEFRQRGYQILENPPEWLLRRMDAVFLLAQRYNIVPLPCWHDWTGGTMVSNENLRQQEAFVKVYGQRYKHLSAMLWDVSNEAATRANPIYDLNWLLHRFLKEKYGTDAALQAAWEDETVTIETTKFENPPHRLWHDRRAHDFQLFRVQVASRWLKGNIEAMRQTGDTHPVTDEYYLLPGGDAFDARKYITFSNIHYYPDWEPGGLRYYDRRMQGRAMTVGEFGRRHHPSMKSGGWSWLPEPKVRDFFRRATFLGVGSGSAMMANWDWKDMRGCVFPWGINYPNELVPKKVLRDWRNLAIFFRSFAPKHMPEDLVFVIPDQFLLGGRQREMEGRIKLALSALSDTNIPFSVIRQYELPELKNISPKTVVFPVPYILSDEDVAVLADFVRRGGTLYLSGDVSYDPERQPTRASVLETLCGAKLVRRRYPDIRREGDPVPAFADLPEVRYDAYPALELAGQTDVLVRHAIGKGQVLFLNDPIELHASRSILAKVYAHLIKLPPLSTDSGVLAYRLPLADGELRLLLNESEADATVGLPKIQFAVSGGSQVGACIRQNGAVTALAIDGRAKAGKFFANGTGRQLILALDGRDVGSSEALLVLPLGDGELVLARNLPVTIGEIVDGKWKTYETLNSSQHVSITELRSTAFLLLCPADQRERWTKAVEALVVQLRPTP